MPEELFYVYCVTNRAPKLKEIEDWVEKSSFIYNQGFYAVISKVSKGEFSKENLERNLADLDWVEKKAYIHERVIERVMKDRCVIPFKFATLFNDESSVKIMLKEQAETFKIKLNYLEDKEEWGIKIYCDIEKLKRTFIKQEDEFLKLDNEISVSSSGKAFFLKKREEALVNAAAVKTLNEYSEESFTRLEKKSSQARVNKLLPKEFTGKKEDMILNAVFLVEKYKVNKFIDAADFLKKQYEDRGFFFDCTGPWPPYNFCEHQTYATI